MYERGHTDRECKLQPQARKTNDTPAEVTQWHDRTPIFAYILELLMNVRHDLNNNTMRGPHLNELTHCLEGLHRFGDISTHSVILLFEVIQHYPKYHFNQLSQRSKPVKELSLRTPWFS